MRRGMQGVIDQFLQLSRWRSNVGQITPTSRPWNNYLYEGDRKMMTRLLGPRYVLDHATPRGAAAAAGVDTDHASGMEHSGTSPPTHSPPSQSPSSGPFSNWIKLVFSSLISILVASWMPKWASVLTIEGKAKRVMHEIEEAAEVVEKVATAVEKLSEEVVDSLPNDTKIKEAASVVEHVSKEAAKDARIAQQIIHQIDDATQDLGELEEIIVPIIQHIPHRDDKKESSL